jgi:hypothetical protein
MRNVLLLSFALVVVALAAPLRAEVTIVKGEIVDTPPVP